MAVKSKMSTMSTRSVTKTTTKEQPSNGNGNGNGSKGMTAGEYAKQQWEKYDLSAAESEKYNKALDSYNKQMKAYKDSNPNTPNINYGFRKASAEEVAAYNRRRLKQNPNALPIKSMNVEGGVTFDTKTGKAYGEKFGKGYNDDNTPRNVTLWTQEKYVKPTPPKKPTTYMPKPTFSRPVEIGKLPIKKAGLIDNKPKAELITSAKKNEMELPAAIAKPTKKSVPKKDSSLFFSREATGRRKNVASGPFSKNRGKYMKTKLTLNYSGQSEANKAARKAAKAENRSTLGARLGYKKEEKLASAYERNKGIFDGETKGEMKSAIKSYKKSSTAGGKKLDASQKQAIKTGRTAAKYVGKLEKKKVKTFTPEALSRKTTVKTQNTIQKAGRKLNSGKGDVVRVSTLPKGQLGVTSTMKKGKMQAGKMRY